MNGLAVLIPVYQNQAGLNRSLHSLRATSGRFDVVVIDDGSPVPITAALEFREGIAIHRLRLDRNGGITRALNHGLEYILSRDYQYIARLDAGDTIAPDRFELQSSYLNSHKDCAAVASFIDFVDENDSFVFRHSAPTSSLQIAREMRVRNCLLHSGVMLRVDAMREIGLYDERYHGAEDYELFLRLLRQHRLAVLPQVLTFTRYDLDGLSIRGRRRQQLSRLRCQLRYFDPSTWYSVFGVARTLAALATPHALVTTWKRARAH
jgi:glycosyltransferase involved in cell wall biosynthesis